jgi:hypothetical protein
VNKANSEPLFQLIRTMKKSERRHFNLYSSIQGGDKLYMKMFSFFDRPEEPDTKEFIEKEGKNKKASWYSMAKNRTYKQVLASLTDLHHDINSEIYSHLTKAQVLFNRELFDLSFKHLNAAKKIALKNECFALAYLACEREYKDLLNTRFDQKRYFLLLKEQEDIMALLNNAKSYYLLAQRIYQFYLTHGTSVTPKEEKAIKEFRKNPLLLDEKRAASVEAREYYHLAKSFLFGMVGDFNNSHFHTLKRSELYFKNPFKVNNNLYSYLFVLNNALVTSVYAKKYDQVLLFLKKLDDIRPVLKADVEKKIAFYMRNHELAYYIDLHQWNKAIEAVKRVENELPYYENSLTEIQRRILFVFIAFIHFSIKEYRQAIFWLNKVVYKGVPKLRLDLFCFFSIIYLIVHYEAGSNKDLLRSIYQSGFRYIYLKEKMTPFYSLMGKFMKKYLLKDVSRSELLAGFRELKKELIKIEKSSLKENAPIYFDFKPWIGMNVERLSGK